MFRKKKTADSLRNQVKRTEDVVRKLDNVNDKLFISLMNINQPKGVVMKK